MYPPAAGRKFRIQFVTICCSAAFVALPQVTHAGVLGYWSFDDAAPTTEADILASSVNSPTLDGTAGSTGTGSTKPLFSADIPGMQILSSSGGSLLNASNGGALYFNNPDAPGNPNSNSGGLVSILDPGGDGSLLKPVSFTIEGFIKLEDFINYSAIFTKNRSGGSSWMVDTDNAGHLRARFDSQPLGSSDSTLGFNQSFTTPISIADGQWHHIALTFNADTRAADLYFDYTRVGGGTVKNQLVYDDSPLRFGASGGGRGYDGFIDEVRLSDTALTPDQFLQAEAVPEPSVAGLTALGMLAFGMRRRRRAS